MMETEREIFKDIWHLLKTYNNPPPIHDERSSVFWYNAGKELTEIVGVKWKNHPLALKLGLAVFVYLENKSKEGADNVLQKQ